MRQPRMQPFTAVLGLVCLACGAGQPDAARSSSSTDAAPSPQAAVPAAAVAQPAAMILHYPHDDHVFGELPPDLTPVANASAAIERHDNRVSGTFDTHLEPGHVGRLLAVVINNPSACERPTPATACGPHEEEFNQAADGGFILGSGAVAGADGSVHLTFTANVGDTADVLCGGAANREFDACARGFALRDPQGAEVTLVVLDNGPASEDPDALAQQLAAPSPCPDCPPFTAQIAIGFGREVEPPPGR